MDFLAFALALSAGPALSALPDLKDFQIVEDYRAPRRPLPYPDGTERTLLALALSALAGSGAKGPTFDTDYGPFKFRVYLAVKKFRILDRKTGEVLVAYFIE